MLYRIPFLEHPWDVSKTHEAWQRAAYNMRRFPSFLMCCCVLATKNHINLQLIIQICCKIFPLDLTFFALG